MNKRIVVVTLLVVLLGVGIWYFFVNSNSKVSTIQPLDNILPFGSGGSNASTGGSTDAFVGTIQEDGQKSHLFKISDIPVAGAVAFNRGGSLVVRYAERSTGHIVDIDPVSLATTKIVNATIPKIYEAVWKTDGSAVIFRTLRGNDTVDSTSYSLIPPSGTSTSDTYTTKSFGLPANISELVSGKNKILYSVKSYPQITSAFFDGTKPATILSLNFNQWALALSLNDSLVSLTTKAESDADGYAYVLDSKTGALTKVLGPYKSLQTQPNSLINRYAYSYVEGGALKLGAYNVRSGSSVEVFPVTVAPKCVWSNKISETIFCGVPMRGITSEQSVNWNRGSVHFSDAIWRINVDSGVSDDLVEPEKTFGIRIDAEKLFLSPDEDYLFFTNKNDLTLWALKLVD